MEFIGYPSIEQYRNVVKNINHSASYVGHDEIKNEPIFDYLLPKPRVKFKGTVKLHGTNASVCWNQEDGLWAQSRKNIITPEKDNAGFASFVKSKADRFLELIKITESRFNIDTKNKTISIYGEWCGQGIQKGVAISEIPKMFVIFGVKISYHSDEDFSYWVNGDNLSSNDEKDMIYNINDFPSYEIEIDFNRPEESQNKLNEITLEVEKECPVRADYWCDELSEDNCELPDDVALALDELNGIISNHGPVSWSPGKYAATVR